MVPLHLLCVLLFCAVSLSEQLSKTELKTESLYTMIGHTETIHCVCRNGSLPITYMLFINQTTVGKRTVSGEREAAFNVTIYNDTRLGSYKCKANNSQQCSPYSAGFSFTLQERLLQVHLLPGSLNTMIGHSERILCTCGNGSLPISYTLTLNEVTIDQRTVSEEREATFNVTIFDETRLGPYKCKANNSLKYSLYSDEFSFILQEQRNQHGYLAWLIPIFILTGILVIIVIIRFARRNRGRVDGQEDQFCAVEAMRGTADKNKSVEDQDVTYCDVVIGRGPASIIKKEESVEYMQVSKKSF
ncbi:allergin-1-like isoform X1 [Dendrobates tinctorius]|uniref:allergin-1-like isoform X1 n=1 Tax=Dendrobates tinctorius TaxID=92724 RepID=UPI003CC9B5D8